MKEEHKKEIMKAIETALNDETVQIQFTNKLSPNYTSPDCKELLVTSRGKVILIETGTHELNLKLEDDKVVLEHV